MLEHEKPIHIVAVVLLLIAVQAIVVAEYFGVLDSKQNSSRNQTLQPNHTACTEEAKLCPDGSSVGRTGPNCEFAECAKTVIAQTEGSPSTDSTSSQDASLDIDQTAKNFCGKSYGKQENIPVVSVRVCEGKLRLVRQCCDNYDVILDTNGRFLAECGGLKGYSEECKKLIDTTTCSLQDFCKIPGEVSDTSSWQTYRNEEYGFEVKYPTEWIVLGKLDDPYGVDFWLAEKNMATKIMDIESGINLSLIGISYCGAYPQDKRCESFKTKSGNSVTIDWDVSGKANAVFNSQNGTYGVSFTLHKVNQETKNTFHKILSTFKFID